MPTAAARWATTVTCLLLFFGCLLGGREARAHFVLLYPPSRGVSLETAPCGGAGSKRGTTVTVLRPGQTILVRWDVQVDHLEPPKFRIAFDDAGQDFPTPVGPGDTSTLPLFIDGILTPGGGVQTKEIALPNIECDNCTLQMLQYLNPKPPYTAGNFYYQCADITLSAAAPAPVDGGGGVSDGGVIAPADAVAREADPAPTAAEPPADAAAAPADGGARRLDAGTPPPASGGSGCRYAGSGRTGRPAPAGLAVMVALAMSARRRRRRISPDSRRQDPGAGASS